MPTRRLARVRRNPAHVGHTCWVRTEGRAISRDEAAEHVGISRKLAAFHLDKLVGRGLLTAHYARLPGRTGPGAGRSSKLYEPSELEVNVSIPERRYDIVGEILVAALEQDSKESAREAATRIAREKGHAIGEEAKVELRLRPPGSERGPFRSQRKPSRATGSSPIARKVAM